MAVKKLIRIHDDDISKNNHYHYLPEEIILEILIRLPVEDLVNFKSVSKLWYSFISNPTFAKTHFTLPPLSLSLQQQQQQHQNLLFTTFHKLTDHIIHYYHYSIDINTNIQNNPPPKQLQLQVPFHVVMRQQRPDKSRTIFPQKLALSLSLEASCDGLLLFQDKYNSNRLYISNPVTGRFDSLPLFPSRHPCFHWALVRDTRIDKYKVFGIKSPHHFILLTLGEKTSTSTTTWKSCQYWHLQPEVPHTVLSQLILVQKNLLWLTIHKDTYPPNHNQDCYYLCELDIHTLHSFRNKLRLDVLKPSNISEFKLQKGLHLLSELKGGSVGLITVSPRQLQMFVLEDKFVGVWTKSHTITLPSLSNLPCLRNGFLSDNTCLIATGGVDSSSNLYDILKVLVHHEGQLCLYDLKTQELRSIGLLSKDRNLCRPYLFHSNSLAWWD